MARKIKLMKERKAAYLKTLSPVALISPVNEGQKTRFVTTNYGKADFFAGL